MKLYHLFIRTLKTLTAGLLALTLMQRTDAASLGGSFSLTGATAGGGGTSAGGSYSLTGSPTTSGAGVASGGTFQLTGGLIGVYIVPSGDVKLELTVTIDGQARLSWPASAAGYQLEFTTALGPGAIWQTVTPAPAGTGFTTLMNQPARFFRLRKP